MGDDATMFLDRGSVPQGAAENRVHVDNSDAHEVGLLGRAMLPRRRLR